MKKTLSFFIALILCFSISSHAFAAEGDMGFDMKVSTNNTDSISVLASQHLENMKAQIGTACEDLGFDLTTFQNMSVGTPFVVYTFNKTGDVLSDDVYSCPLLYNGNIVGIIGVYYDSITNAYYYSLGREYADQLNGLKKSSLLKLSDGIVIGRIGDKLFATDGSEVEILIDQAADNAISVNVEEIKNVSRQVKKNASTEYSTIVSIEKPSKASPLDQSFSGTRLLPNPLPVPHVSQGSGICGVAAWAAVLNYRFSTSYTTPSLTTAMTNGGYTHGTGGKPNMTDYKNYANDNYSAGCKFSSSPLSFSKVTTAITGGRPIMGSWHSGSGSDKVYHAIIITGYIKNSASNYTYYLKNPWYSDATTITVTSSSNVVYVDGSYTWTLSQVVY